MNFLALSSIDCRVLLQLKFKWMNELINKMNEWIYLQDTLGP